MSYPNPLRRFAVGCNRVGIAAAELALLLLMLLTVYAVVARYGFGSPSVHAMEFSVYLLLVTTWASLGWVHLEDRHVCMEAFNSGLGARWKKFSNVVAQLTVLVFCVTLIGSGLVSAWSSYSHNYRSTSLLEFPLWIPYGLMPLGGLLLAFIALHRLFGGETLKAKAE